MQIHHIPFRLMLALSLTLFSTLSPGGALRFDDLPRIKAITLAADSKERLFAATDQGLYVSLDQGQNWNLSYPFKLPTTLLTRAPDGTLYAFVAAKGLIRMKPGEAMWTPVNNALGAQVLVQLSASTTVPNRLVGLNQFGGLIVSDDAGRNWHRMNDRHAALGEAAARGKQLFAEHCQSCHGLEGVGETYTLEALTDKQYIMAPALNGSAHAWHHTDDALVGMILDGSQRTPRMKAWKQEGLTEGDARDLVSYIKSLWSDRLLACQGPRHMQCM